MVACVRIGAVALSCNEQLRAKDLRLRIDAAQPKLIVADERNSSTISEAAPACPVITVPDDSLFVAPWIYRWGLLFEYSISAYWVGELGHAFAACQRLLKLDDLPDPYRKQTRENQAHTVRAMAAREGRIRPAPPARASSSTGGRVWTRPSDASTTR